MTLTFLLVLAGLVAANEPTLPLQAGRSPGAQPPSGAEGGRPEEPFKTAPLELGRPSPTRQLEFFTLPQGNLRSVQAGAGEQQGKRAGVVCTMRIIQAEPSLDAGMVRSVPAGHLDRIVRDDLAACAP